MNIIFLKISVPSNPYYFASGENKLCYPLKEGQSAEEFIESSMNGAEILQQAVFSSDSFDADCFKFLNSFALVDGQVEFVLSEAKETFVNVVDFYAQRQKVTAEVDEQKLADAATPAEVIALWPDNLQSNPYA